MSEPLEGSIIVRREALRRSLFEAIDSYESLTCSCRQTPRHELKYRVVHETLQKLTYAFTFGTEAAND